MKAQFRPDTATFTVSIQQHVKCSTKLYNGFKKHTSAGRWKVPEWTNENDARKVTYNTGRIGIRLKHNNSLTTVIHPSHRSTSHSVNTAHPMLM